MIDDATIKRIAEENGAVGSFITPTHILITPDGLQSFARAIEQLARAEQRESDAKVCEREHVGMSIIDDCFTDEDQAYNTALRHARESILANTGEVIG